MKIYLIRHGETKGNSLKRYIGVTDEPILQETYLKLKCLEYPQVEAVFESPMLRCRQTGEAIYPGIPVRIIEEFAECNFGKFENKSWMDMADDPEYQAWVDSNGLMPFPEGECLVDFQKRCCRGFERAVSECMRKKIENVAMVVHGGTIMSIMDRYMVPHRAYFDWAVKNGCGYEIEIEPTLWTSSRREIHKYKPLVDKENI